MATDRKMDRAKSSSTSGGPLVVSYQLTRPSSACNDECRFDLLLPHDTTVSRMAQALRLAADQLEALNPKE